MIKTIGEALGAALIEFGWTYDLDSGCYTIGRGESFKSYTSESLLGVPSFEAAKTLFDSGVVKQAEALYGTRPLPDMGSFAGKHWDYKYTAMIIGIFIESAPGREKDFEEALYEALSGFERRDYDDKLVDDIESGLRTALNEMNRAGFIREQ